MGVVERSFREDRVFGLFLGSVVNVQLCVLLTGTCDAFYEVLRDTHELCCGC
jgi:hypothetical protein